jgi:hypothetical protein
MAEHHLVGTFDAVRTGVANAMSEVGITAPIQRIEYSARRSQIRANFRAANDLHLGGLDLYPVPVAIPGGDRTS